MIEPLRCCCISGTAARDQSQVPPTLVRNTASQSAGLVVRTVPPQEKPAAAISTSSGPRHDVANHGLRKIGLADIADMHRSFALRALDRRQRLPQGLTIAIDQRDT